MASIELTWEQFEEIRKNLEAVHQAHALAGSEGHVDNTIISSDWDADKVEITLDI